MMLQTTLEIKRDWKTFTVCLAIPLAVGGLAALFSGGGMAAFSQLRQPPLSPPGWLFPVVWTLLYLMMGCASYLVLRSNHPQEQIHRALTHYLLQLAANFVWPILFFAAGLYWIAFFWLLFLWGLILVTIDSFYRLSRPAAFLLVPYLVWVTFAGYLNVGIAILN